MASYSHYPVPFFQRFEDEADGSINEPGLRHVYDNAGKRSGSG